MKASYFCVVLLLLGCEKFWPTQTTTNDTEKKEDKLIQVYVQTVDAQTMFEPIVFAGKASPVVQQGLYSPISGVVSQIYPHIGDQVTHKQPIMQISPRNKGLEDYKPFQITAPMAGHVIQYYVKEGERLNADEKAGVIADLSRFNTSIQASLKDLSYLKVGQVLDVILAEQTSLQQETTGIINEISPVADPLTNTFSVKVDIQCSPDQPCFSSLKAGTYVKVIWKKNHRTGIRLPLSFLYQNNTKALILKEGHHVQWSTVTIGKHYGDDVEILKGLSVGDQVVRSFSRKPKDHDQVMVIEKTP